MGTPDHLNGKPPRREGGKVICPNCMRDLKEVDIKIINRKATRVGNQVKKYCPYCGHEFPAGYINSIN